MKVPLIRAAERLGLHPGEVVVRLARLTGSFEDLFPDLEEGLVETLEQLIKPRGQDQDKHSDKEVSADVIHEPQIDLSEAARQIARALSQKKYWGNNSVPVDALKNGYCTKVQGLETELEELIQQRIVIRKQSRGPVSLNPNAKGALKKLGID